MDCPNCFGVSWPKSLHIFLPELNLFAHQFFASSIQTHQFSSTIFPASCSAIIYPWLFPIPHPLPFIISCSIEAKLSQNSMGNRLESLPNLSSPLLVQETMGEITQANPTMNFQTQILKGSTKRGGPKISPRKFQI
jgi:hypothetical protein